MTKAERLEGLEYQCAASAKIDLFGSPDGVSQDATDTTTLVAATGAMTKPDHIALPNMTAPYVIVVVTDLGGGGAVTMTAWMRENVTAWGAR